MRILFVGCVEFSYSFLQHLLTLPSYELVGVVTKRESPFNSDFRSLEELAARAKVPCFFYDSTRPDDLARWTKDLAPDVVYCFGWSHLLKREFLDIPRLGVIGYHPTALPQNRSRHPVIWALALGLTRTASTFFFMDEGADSGDILSQVEVEIEDSDDAGTLYRKLNDLALRQICDFTPKLAQGTFERIPQDNSRANTWRKRNAQDGQIDWRMSSSSIRNLVRALARPYPGAHCVWQGQDVKIWKVERVEWNQPNLEPGKVLSSGADGIVVKSGDGAIRIVTHEFSQLPQEGSYL